jgi:hypothetical protein
MYFFILGFQRLVWWPKWTPASSNSFMEIVTKIYLALCYRISVKPVDGPILGILAGTICDNPDNLPSGKRQPMPTTDWYGFNV